MNSAHDYLHGPLCLQAPPAEHLHACHGGLRGTLESTSVCTRCGVAVHNML